MAHIGNAWMQHRPALQILKVIKYKIIIIYSNFQHIVLLAHLNSTIFTKRHILKKN